MLGSVKRQVQILFANFILLSLLFISVNAQDKIDVLVRFNEQENIYRLVLETKEELMNTAKINVTDKNIFINFKNPINLIFTKRLPFETKLEDNELIIILNKETEVKTFKLKNPSRLVFDIKKSYIKQSQTGEPKEESKTNSFKSEEQKIQQKKFIEAKTLKLASKVFVIDPGHGGYEFGVTVDSYIEKNITLALAKDLERKLKELGNKVYLVRRVDQYVPISGRIEFAYQKKPDIFLSLHLSSDNKFLIYNPKFEEVSSEEIIDFYSITKRQKRYIENSKALAESLVRVLKEKFKIGIENKELPIPLLKSVNAPCVMIEFPSPKYIVYDEKTRNEIVETIFKGLAIFEQ